MQLLYQHEFSASGIQPTAPEKTEPIELVEDLAGTPPAKYFIAVCGAHPATIPRRRSLAVGGIEHQIAITQDVRDARRAIDALLQQREQNAREYGENLAAHRGEIDRLRKEIDAFLQQQEQSAREYSENLAAHHREMDSLQNEIDALRHQEEERAREYARNLAIRAEVIRQQEQQCAAQRIELEWLYRWIPVNKLARRLLFGRNLREKLMARLRLRS